MPTLLLARGSLDMPESRDVLADQRSPVFAGLVRRGKARVLEIDQRRLELAPSEVDDDRVDQHEFAGELG